MTFVYFTFPKSCYIIVFNIKAAMCTNTARLLAYVKTKLLIAHICYNINN